MVDNLLDGYVNETRFWSNVVKTETCWIWKGKSRSTWEVGYGLCVVRVQSPRGTAYRTESAHRVSYELARGPIPPGLHILHSCDNGLCVNPAHLRAGTREDNEDDKKARNRHPRGGRTPGVALPRADLPTRTGERHDSAKLKDAEVDAIRERYAADTTVTAYALAREYGVTIQTMTAIITGKSRRTAAGPISTIRRVVGVAVPGSKLTAEQVKAMRREYDAGDVTLDDLAAKYPVTRSVASRIVRRESWRHVPDEVPAPTGLRHRPKALTKERVRKIRLRHARGVSGRRLAADYGVSHATISLIVNRKTFRDVP